VSRIVCASGLSERPSVRARSTLAFMKPRHPVEGPIHSGKSIHPVMPFTSRKSSSIHTKVFVGFQRFTRRFRKLLHRYRVRRTSDVVDSRAFIFEKPHHERRRVAHVDELHVALRRSGGGNVAAFCEAIDPIRETIGGIVRSDEKTRAHEDRPIVKDSAHDVFRASLLGPVVVRIIVGQVRYAGRVRRVAVADDFGARIVDRDR